MEVCVEGYSASMLRVIIFMIKLRVYVETASVCRGLLNCDCMLRVIWLSCKRLGRWS